MNHNALLQSGLPAPRVFSLGLKMTGVFIAGLIAVFASSALAAEPSFSTQPAQAPAFDTSLRPRAANMVADTALDEDGLGDGNKALNDADQATQPTAQKMFSSQLRAGVGYTQRPYLLGPNDVLSVSYLSAPELNLSQVRVGPDGHIMIPAAGKAYASGLTLDALKTTLEQQLSRYLVNPVIAINLVATKPYVIQVAGNGVMRPGTYEFNTNPSSGQVGASIRGEGNVKLERSTPLLSNALLASGGVMFDADVEHVVIENRQTNERYEVNLMDLIQGPVIHDVVLAHGDIIHVPKLPTPYAVDMERYKAMASATFSQSQIPVRVFGFVNEPGLIQVDAAQSPRLSSAIAGAKGYYEADFPYPPDKVYISRADANGRLTTTVVNPKKEDPYVMANDIVYVPQKSVPKVLLVFRSLSTILTPFNQTAGGYNSWALVFDPTRNFIR
ncbi:MAG: polysaccharide biosynthesis/export family protein [Vampirovibrionales bacterium]|nr:polysaccharide biosynthesis/export family protein [Vampirovibrionales bacterium]